MSCDLSDPRIPEAYEQIMAGEKRTRETEREEGEPTNWMILGYHDSRDTISFYSSGSGGTEEVQKHLSDEVLYIYLRILYHRFVLVSYVPENVSGVRRARALVHGRAVATLLKDFEIQVSASKPEDLTEADLKSRLKPRDNSQTAGHGAPGAPPRAKKPKVPKDGADAAAGKGGYSSDGEPPPPSASNEPPQTSPGAPAVQASPVVPARTRVAGGAPWTEALPGVPAEPAPAPAPGIAAEAAAGDEGGRGKAPESAGDRAHEAAAAAAQEEARKVAAAEASKQKAAAAAEAAKKKEEADKRAAEAVRARREAEKGGLAGNQKGWICVQFEATFWKRRWFELRGKALYLFKDPNDQDPVSAIELGPQVENLEDAHRETLMPHSFKIAHKAKGPVYFYSDDFQAKEYAMDAIRKAAA